MSTLARAVAGGDVLLRGQDAFFVSPLYVYFLGIHVLRFRLLPVSRRSWRRSSSGPGPWRSCSSRRRSGSAGRVAWIASGLAAATGLFVFYEVLLAAGGAGSVPDGAGDVSGDACRAAQPPGSDLPRLDWRSDCTRSIGPTCCCTGWRFVVLLPLFERSRSGAD
jgi:hypothetical protein